MNEGKLTYAVLDALEKRLNERLPYVVDIFDDQQYRLSRIRDRVRVAFNRRAFYRDRTI